PGRRCVARPANDGGVAMRAYLRLTGGARDKTESVGRAHSRPASARHRSALPARRPRHPPEHQPANRAAVIPFYGISRGTDQAVCEWKPRRLARRPVGGYLYRQGWWFVAGPFRKLLANCKDGQHERHTDCLKMTRNLPLTSGVRQAWGERLRKICARM